MHELYQSKEKRDARARELQAAGHSIRRSSVRNQQLHPMYVKDYVGPLDTGFGNTQYQTFWSVLYQIEER